MEQSKLVDDLNKELTPALEEIGLELVDLEYLGSPAGNILRVFIDRPEGVDLDVCALASEKVSLIMDERDLIDSAFTLEVSSPGAERPLKKLKDYKRFIGSKVAVKTIMRSPEGRRKYTGKLIEADQSGFAIELDEMKIEFEYEEVQSVRLVLEI